MRIIAWTSLRNLWLADRSTAPSKPCSAAKEYPGPLCKAMAACIVDQIFTRRTDSTPDAISERLTQGMNQFLNLLRNASSEIDERRSFLPNYQASSCMNGTSTLAGLEWKKWLECILWLIGMHTLVVRMVTASLTWFGVWVLWWTFGGVFICISICCDPSIHSTNQPINQWNTQWTNQSVNQSINQSNKYTSIYLSTYHESIYTIQSKKNLPPKEFFP